MAQTMEAKPRCAKNRLVESKDHHSRREREGKGEKEREEERGGEVID